MNSKFSIKDSDLRVVLDVMEENIFNISVSQIRDDCFTGHQPDEEVHPQPDPVETTAVDPQPSVSGIKPNPQKNNRKKNIKKKTIKKINKKTKNKNNNDNNNDVNKKNNNKKKINNDNNEQEIPMKRARIILEQCDDLEMKKARIVLERCDNLEDYKKAIKKQKKQA